MEEFTGPCAIALGSGILGVGVSFLESKMTNAKRNNTHYLKLFLLIVFVTLIVLNISGSISLKKTVGGSSRMNKDILTGNPNF